MCTACEQELAMKMNCRNLADGVLREKQGHSWKSLYVPPFRMFHHHGEDLRRHRYSPQSTVCPRREQADYHVMRFPPFF